MHTGRYVGRPRRSAKGNKVATHRNPDLTRQALLQGAFREIYKTGFQAASLDNLLASAGVTKGALYHHFGSKQELGYAVVDELIREHILERWVRPLEKAENPIDGLLGILRSRAQQHPFDRRLGCPLNNLAQEMSPLDEGFRKRVESVFQCWREGIAKALQQGQENGQVRSDVDASEAAVFFLASLEGSVSLAKNAQDDAVFENCKAGLVRYLEGLRSQQTN